LPQLSAAARSQEPQKPPPVPQAVKSFTRQLWLEQQPLGHEVGSQTQPPATHRCPVTQATQATPPSPQLAVDEALQVLPLQHPLGQEVASQTQAPPRHRWPAPQGEAAPHLQAPFAQVSALVASQEEQAPPPIPQVAREGALQVVPAQQPAGHDVASHTQAPALQRWPEEHAAHATPLTPQVRFDETLQTFPLQQPVGHEVESQTQPPATHR